MKKLFFILLSMQMLFALEVQEIKRGDTIDDSIERLEKKYYKVNIKDGKNIRATLTNLNSKIYLYTNIHRLNNSVESSVPTIRSNDCYSTKGDNSKEECYHAVESNNPGQWGDKEVYIMVYGAERGSYTLEVKEEEIERLETLTDKALTGNVQKGEYKDYRIDGKAQEIITVTLSDLTADADLRVKIGKKANQNTFDCKSTNGGSRTDSCTVTLEEDATVYVNVDGYKAADYSIKKTIKSNNTNQELIETAKEHCLHKKNGTDTILCSEEENIVYLLTTDSPEFVHGSLNFTHHKHYRISIAPSKEKVTLIDEYKYEQYMNSTQTFHAKLKDTPLYFISHKRRDVDIIGHVALYYQDKVLKKFGYNDLRYAPTDILRNMKTFDNGKRLSLQYDRINDDPSTTYTEIYDISNPSNIKLIKTIKKDLF